jgi:hypothetical protein
LSHDTGIKCPKCGEPSELLPSPPWDAEPQADLCVKCENEAEQAAEDKRVQDSIQAAARAGRFDLI